MKKNTRLNFILNLIRLTLGSVFILITMPYITKTLGSNKLGAVEYIDSIVSYFLLFTALGIPNYGVREIARVQNEKKELSKISLELIIILAITTLIGYIIYIFCCFYLNAINKEFTLALIMGTNILLTNFGVEWFYIGIENQSYITKRFIIVRIITLFLLFIFIKKQEDYLIYGLILVFMMSGSNIFNLYNLKNYIDIGEIKNINLRKHIKPIVTIFVASLAVSIYLRLDTVMIGSMIGNKSVAYYVVANKLVRFELTLVTALGIVTIPRLSNALKIKDMQTYKKYANISLKYILMFSIPLMICTFLFSKDIIYLMAGKNFQESIFTMKIISIIIFVVGLAYFIGFQIFYPNGLERYYTYSVTIAAIINFICNYIFIPKYAQNGAAFGTVIAEITGVMIMLVLGRKKLKEIDFYKSCNLKYMIAGLLMIIVIYILQYVNFRLELQFIIKIFISFFVYFLSLIIMKEELIIKLLLIVREKRRQR